MNQNLSALIKTLQDALDLLHLYRNSPEKVVNNARQVDPIIRALRVRLGELQEAKKKNII